jgi:hypothetical protein
MIPFGEAMAMPLLSGGGSAASTGGMAAMGPLGLAAGALQAGASIFGASQARASARDAINAAEEAKIRDMGFNMFMMERDKAKQMEGLREGMGFMQSPIFQQNEAQEFGRQFALAGKYGFNPYTTATAVRLFGG